MSVRLFSLLHVFLLLDGANPIYAANPVRKVVNLLQNMKTKVEKEGETEKELYEKFQCYCKKNIGEMEESLKVNEAKLPPLRKNLVATEEELNKVTAQIQTAKTERQEAEDGVAQAAALRRGEAESFQKTSEEQTNAIESIEQAIAALTKGMAESFLQTDAAESLRRFAFDKDGLEEMERQDLLAFLQHGSDYVPQSGQILGMLKHMGSDTREALAEAQATEAKAVQEFKELSAAKSKEIKALTTTIEEKVEDQGELKVALVRWKSDLADTEAAREEDQKVLLSLHSSCDKKASAWEARVKTRAEELLAIDETVKVLDSDDARNSLRKALPETSFLQVDSEDRKARALQGLLRQAPGSGADLLLLALKGQKIGFDKVVQMIDSMKVTMKKEQENEKKKKEYCKQQFTGSDDKKRGLLFQVSNKETKMESAKDVLKVMESEIQELNEGLQRLDKDVADATEQRKKEHQEFLEMEKTSGEAAQLLQVAKKRLKQFYAKPPSLVEVSELVSVPGQAPETFDDYHKADEAAGVFVLLDALIRDIEHQMSQAETEEQEDQKGYEKIMQDRSKKRESDSQSVAKKTARKADVSSDLQVLKEGKANVKKELSATEDYIKNLHDECDWLLSNFQARSEAREEEVESLDRAKAVLQGAEFSFLQVRRRGFLAR